MKTSPSPALRSHPRTGMPRLRRPWLLALLCPAIVVGCVYRMHRAVAPTDALHTVDREAPFLKVHMRDGSLYVLSSWAEEEGESRVTGSGTHYGADRQVLEEGTFSVPVDSVALFETNVARPSPNVAALGVITGITAGVAVYCATNTKACFGSCPTFYVTDGSRDVLQAEGFSASVAPSLEARDVDALYRAASQGREVRVEMLNEAYETHVVRQANLLAIPRTEGRRVLSDEDGRFWTVTEPVSPSSCVGPEGDCAEAVASFDEKERWSEADSTDLAARETIDLAFDLAADAPALVVASRQTLLPTYVLYQAFAYLGTTFGQWLAALERSDGAAWQGARGVADALGGVDVLVANGAGGWDSVTTIRETGPLAADVRLVPLPATRAPPRVRLRMARGAWRLDYVGLASVESRVEPIRLQPDVFVDGRRDPVARARLVGPTEALVTFPGDRYTLVYRLPAGAANYELFLETKGYYLEWMRKEWLAEEDPASAAALFLDPAGSLRRLAPEFKRAEPGLETAFWRSKYVGY